ncbi:MAG: response regulator [Ignavibacteriae bacterium]|nr:response regulator [Ignavibacteriota bacterium]
MHNKTRILFVEDDQVLRITLSRELSVAGYSVTTASDGSEAIDLVEQLNFDLALLDIRIPKVDGFDVLKFIKKNFPSIKVIMLTAYADLKSSMEAKRLGAEDLVSKPYNLEDLCATIERVLNS